LCRNTAFGKASVTPVAWGLSIVNKRVWYTLGKKRKNSPAARQVSSLTTPDRYAVFAFISYYAL
jgi:hypothetical protein